MFRPVEKNFDLVAAEHEILQFWKDTDAFEKLRAKNAGRPKWSFLDGPITANNPMGVHHAWGRTLKDCYQRFHAMKGRELRYQNGFDCQGLWVEVEVEKELGFKTKRDIEAYGLEKFINQCKERVNKFARVQTEQSVRLGYWMDWDREEDFAKPPGERRSYFTMSDENNYTIWAFLKKCHERKLIYKGLDAMPWCPRCGTGISEQERREGYKRILDQAVYVKLRLRGRPGEHLLVWTTTPWTLAANVACAVHPEMPYVKARQGGEVYYLARELLRVLKEHGPFEILEELPGSRLLGLEYEGPFDDLPKPAEVQAAHRVIAWKEVTATDGTGVVHIAPGCGKEDFDLSKELNLPVLAPIDEAGVYAPGYGFLSGRFAGEVANDVLEELRRRNVYYKREMYEHDYPHCWRCKTQLLFRAVDEWYINMSWREEIMKIVQPIRWIPDYGKDLELDWLANMHDWMISKKRYWGLALPIFACECGAFEVIGSREELKARAVAGWEQFEGHSPHRPWVDAIRIRCAKCGGQAARIPDVGNPWLDAGIVPYSTVRYNTDREYWKQWIPADLVLECFPGQFRNWFYALLAMSAMMEQTPPFRTLLGHAFVRDEKGEEMSKSGPNSIVFDEGAEKAGVDAMRWLFCRQNPSNNLNFGYTLTEQVRRKVFNTWWNTLSFFVSYARTDDFDPALPKIPVAERQDLDRWILSRLQELLATANERMAEYDAPSLVRAAEEFIDALSTWYVRRSRRRFWRPKNPHDRDKLAAYQTLHEALVALCKALAPVVPFLTERFYQRLVRDVDPAAPESVHHCDYPQPDPALHDEALSREMDAAMQIVSAALALREAKKLRVRQPLQEMKFEPANEIQKVAVERFKEHILDELNIKKIIIETLGIPDFRPDMKFIGTHYGRDTARIRQVLSDKTRNGLTNGITMDAWHLALANCHNRGAGFDKQAWKDEFATQLTQLLAQLPGYGDLEIEPDAIIVERSGLPSSFAISEDKGFFIAINTQITPELEREGLSRDIVRHIQQIRKELDLDLMDHVNVAYETADEVLLRAIEENRQHIRGETLCNDLFSGHSEAAKEITLSGRDIRLAVQKVA